MTPIRTEAAVLVASSVLASYWLLDGISVDLRKRQKRHKLMALALWIAALVACVALWH